MHILVVDDDRMAVKYVASILKQKELGISEIFEAYSVKQAMEVIENHSIEILLCDIEMPKGSGYDLLAWMNRNHYQVVSVFITSHAKFSYVTQAMEMRVVEYLLKPVSTENLIKVVKKAITMAEENNRKKKNEEIVLRWKAGQELRIKEFWRKILLENVTQEYIMDILVQRFDISKELGSHYYPILIHYQIQTEKNLQWDAKTLDFTIENVASEFLFGKPDSGNVLSLEENTSVVLYKTGHETNPIMEEKCQVLLQKWKRFLPFCKIGLYVFQSVAFEEITKTVQKLCQWKQTMPLYEEGIHVYQGKVSDEDILGAEYEPVEYIKNYFVMHMNEDITRDQMAEAVHLSPDYLSRLFREKTGVSMMDYLFEQRMIRAKELLLHTQKTISEIGNDVGYGDTSYFTRMFRKKYNSSPRDYRKQGGWKKDEA